MKGILTFLRDNIYIVIAAIILAVLFFWVGLFQEMVYGALRLFAVVLIAAIVLHWKFPDTVHKYIRDDELIADFKALDPKHRVYVVFGTIAVLFIVAALCFTHA
jgi:hypothetical protein